MANVSDVDLIEVDFDDRTFRIPRKALCKLQAVWKGTVVRIHLAAIRHHFLQIVKDIEQSEDLQVSWNEGFLRKPSIISKKKAAHIQKKNLGSNTINKPILSKDNDGFIKQGPPKNLKYDQHLTNIPTPVTNQHLTNIPAPVTNPVVKNSSQYSCDKENKQCEHHNLTADSNQYAEEETRESDSVIHVNNKIDNDIGRNNTENKETLSCHSGSPWKSKEWSLKMKETAEKDDFIEMLHLNQQEVSNEELDIARGHIAMEMLWVQQAITSRKQYLKLRSEMSTAAADV